MKLKYILDKVYVFVVFPGFGPQHPFVSQPLSRTLAIELLDKASNPDHAHYSEFEDDDTESEVSTTK